MHVTDDFTERYAALYDSLYSDKDYDAEVAFVVQSLRRFASETNSILDLGCGTGSHSLKLAEHKFEVTGVDKSPNMLARAMRKREFADKEVQNRLQFHEGDLTTLRLNRRFDAVISLFHVMNYQLDDSAVRIAICRAREHLKEGGLFLFDFWHDIAVLNERPAVRIKRFENDDLKIVRISESAFDAHSRTVTVKYETFVTDKLSNIIDNFISVHQMHFFSIPAVEQMLLDCGFTHNISAAWQSACSPDEETFSVYCVATAR